MLEVNKYIFHSFQKLHDDYSHDPKKWQNTFNSEGQKVLHIIQKWENTLCAKSESGKYAKFSSNLADKFWTEVRLVFPKIDYVGMKLPA